MKMLKEGFIPVIYSTDQTGVLFETLFLTATKLDVRFDLFSQPIGIPELRQEMAQILKVKYPQILIRMGYADPARHTPRRSVEDVLTHRIFLA